MENEAKDDNSAEKTVDAAATEEAVNVAVVEDSKDVNVDKKVVDAIATDDFDDANAGKKRFVNASLMNTLIMVLVALISIVCSFAFVSKISTSFEENDFEVQDVNSVSTVERIKDVPQRETNMKQENKKAKTNDVTRAGVEKGNTDDISSDEEAGSLMDVFVVPLESIVVNLGGVGSSRYLRIQISLGVDSEETQKKISEKSVILKDKMISFFSAKTVKDVETEGGLFKLRLEIKDLLNKLLGSGDIIKQVYFSDFIVQ